ncbi:MAG: prepilin-type N-terminal cleavage/methylation domain-containing protein [Candidatus Schekmanbacteria bacterium]|nr:prepilin-type N-terminal cleavage/methylation domain-containing protein [Candidatus Schekmanbacteria bacterium]
MASPLVSTFSLRAPRHSGRESGVTLLELLIVVAIVAILATGAVIALSAYKQTFQLDFSAQMLVSEARLARYWAMSEKVSHRLRVANGNQVLVERSTGTGWAVRDMALFTEDVRVRNASNNMPTNGGITISTTGKAESTAAGTGLILEYLPATDNCRCVTLDNFVTVSFATTPPACTVGGNAC